VDLADADFEPGSNFEQAQPNLADGDTLQLGISEHANPWSANQKISKAKFILERRPTSGSDISCHIFTKPSDSAIRWGIH
jgi:hypothetical protein